MNIFKILCNYKASAQIHSRIFFLHIPHCSWFCHSCFGHIMTFSLECARVFPSARCASPNQTNKHSCFSWQDTVQPVIRKCTVRTAAILLTSCQSCADHQWRRTFWSCARDYLVIFQRVTVHYQPLLCYCGLWYSSSWWAILGDATFLDVQSVVQPRLVNDGSFLHS